MFRPLVVGILAHVDAGKTTLSEQLLYRAGVMRAPGRVDHGNTLLDTDEIERARGITVFSNQAWFSWKGRRFTLMDTPGHADFAAEAERALSVLDMAVLVIDGSAPIPAHTSALFRLLSREYCVPTVLFVNKTDLAGYDAARVFPQVSKRLTPSFVHIQDGSPDFEQLALLDDGFLESYLTGGATPPGTRLPPAPACARCLPARRLRAWAWRRFWIPLRIWLPPRPSIARRTHPSGRRYTRCGTPRTASA